MCSRKNRCLRNFLLLSSWDHLRVLDMLSSQNHVSESMKLPNSYFLLPNALVSLLFVSWDSSQSQVSLHSFLQCSKADCVLVQHSSYAVFVGAPCKPQHLHELDKGLWSLYLLSKKTKLTLLLWLRVFFLFLSVTTFRNSNQRSVLPELRCLDLLKGPSGLIFLK